MCVGEIPSGTTVSSQLRVFQFSMVKLHARPWCDPLRAWNQRAGIPAKDVGAKGDASVSSAAAITMRCKATFVV